MANLSIPMRRNRIVCCLKMAPYSFIAPCRARRSRTVGSIGVWPKTTWAKPSVGMPHSKLLVRQDNKHTQLV